MSMENKTYPPTELKLRKLRRAGIVAVSEYVLSAGVVFGTLLSSYLLAVWGFEMLLAYATELYLNPQVQQPFPVYRFLALILGVGIVPCLLLGSLQTKFLVSLNACLPRFSGLIRFPNPFNPENFRSAVASLLAVLGWILVISLLVFGNFIEGSLGVEGFKDAALGGQEEKGVFVRAEIEKTFQIFSIAAASYFIFLSSLSWFVVYLRFLKQHRMTKSEIEAEIKEEEVSPEVKRRVRESYSD